MGEDNLREDSLDEFDLDLDGDSGDDADDFTDFFDDDGEEDAEDVIPKSRVKEIVKKRLARERNKQKALRDQFKEVYGMDPEEVIEYGRKEAAKYAALMQGQGPFSSPAGTQRPLGAAEVPPQGAGAAPGEDALPQDPVLRKVLELEARQREMEEARQREREAAEFIQKYPHVKFSDIPPEVLQRRAMGGVTLAEAYKLYMADKEAAEAAKRAAEEAARNAKARARVGAEGADFSGGSSGGDAEGSLTEEERTFAKLYGMTPKQYAAYKAKVRRLREEEGS